MFGIEVNNCHTLVGIDVHNFTEQGGIDVDNALKFFDNVEYVTKQADIEGAPLFVTRCAVLIWAVEPSRPV